MTAAEIAQALPRGRKTGDGWIACCPGHEDKNPSLSLRDADADGKILLNCFAGCDYTAVVAALKNLGLWCEREQNDSYSERDIEATYDYRDADGRLLYQVVRKLGKKFSQRRPDGAGGWIWNLKGVCPTLYHLRELIEAPSCSSRRARPASTRARAAESVLDRAHKAIELEDLDARLTELERAARDAENRRKR